MTTEDRSTADEQNAPLPDGGPGASAHEGDHWDLAQAHDPAHPVTQAPEEPAPATQEDTHD